MIRILIVDDNEFMRKMMAAFLEMEEDLNICGEAESMDTALEAIERLNPDVALVDISLNSDEGGIELIRRLRAKNCMVPVLTISLHENALYAKRIMDAGGQGYIMKQEAADHIVHAIRQVSRGEIYFREINTARQ